MAAKMLCVFAEWLCSESHIVERKHILLLLLPFARTSFKKASIQSVLSL